MRLLIAVLSPLLAASSLACDFLERFEGGDTHCATDLVDPPRGELATEFGDVPFNSVDVALSHRSGGEGAGCVTDIELVFYQANSTRCSMTVRVANSLNDSGYLKLKDLEIRAGEACPDFPDEMEGLYTGDDLGDSGIEVLGVAHGEQQGCYEDGLVLHLEGVSIKRYAGVETSEANVEFDDTEIVIVGRMTSLGVDGSCPESD